MATGIAAAGQVLPIIFLGSTDPIGPKWTRKSHWLMSACSARARNQHECLSTEENLDCRYSVLHLSRGDDDGELIPVPSGPER